MLPVDLLHVCFGGMGGHMSVVKELSQELSSVGISTGVIALAPEGDLIRDPAAWGSITHLDCVPVTRRADLSSMWGALLSARRAKARLVLVHTTRHATAIAVGRLLSGQGVRIVTRETHSLPLRSLYLNMHSFQSLLWSRGVVFLTPENQSGYPFRRLPLPGLRHQRVIPNGVETKRYQPATARTYPLGPRAVLGMAGRFVAGKDFGTVIRSLAILRDRHPTSWPSLVLAGDGPELASLEQLVESLDLHDGVTFLGRVPEGDMPGFFSGIDVYVHATDGEAFSMSLIMAAAAALPIVASDVPGVRDTFTDGLDSVLVQPRSPVDLARAIEGLLWSPSSLAGSIAARACAMAVEDFSSARMATSYLAFFADLDACGPWAQAATRLAVRH